MALMLAPQPNAFFTVSSGAVYTSDNAGIIKDVASAQDVSDLQVQGCFVLTPPPTDLLFYLQGANFNSTSDQRLSAAFSGKFRIKRIVVLNATISLTAAAGGFYTALSKGGTTIVASSQAYSSLTSGNIALECTLDAATTVLGAGTPLYLSLSTPQGAAATADIFVYGDVYVAP